MIGLPGPGRAVGAALLVVVALAWPGGPATAQDEERAAPTVQVAPGTVSLGEWVEATGQGLPPGELLLVEVCGSHVRSALGCDTRTAVDAAVDARGRFTTKLLIERPPAPCPCTVRVRGQATDGAVSTAIEIRDMDRTDEPVGEAGPPVDTATPKVVVSGVELVGGGSWATAFGASPARTFRYTVTNEGGSVADGLAVALRAGPDGDRSEVLRAPPVGSLEAGESRTFEVDLDLGPFARGEHQVDGLLVGAGARQRFEASTSSFPWMLLVIPGVVLAEVALLVTRNWARSRLQRRSQAAVVSTAVAASVVVRVEQTHATGLDPRALAARVVRRLEPTAVD